MSYRNLARTIKNIERRIGTNQADKEGVFLRLLDDTMGRYTGHQRVTKEELGIAAGKGLKESRIEDLPEAIKLAKQYNVGGKVIQWGEEELAEYHSKK